MTFLILSRICLFALLGCDYVWDPFLGTNPQSHELASTEAFCQSLEDCQAVHCNAVQQFNHRDHSASSHQADNAPFWHPAAEASIVAIAIAVDGLLYTYMSLQR